MVSPVKNIASRYLDALPESSPARLPLGQANKYNIGSPPKLKFNKHDSPDLDDLARQMNIETPSKPSDLIRSRFETPSATVSSFKSTSSARFSTSKGDSAHKTNLDVPLDQISPSKPRSSSDQKAYEYLCRIQAIKNWLQAVLGEEIPQTAPELISHIRNGIYLAKLANAFLPVKKLVYLQDSKLEFRHTENINRFFKLLKYLGIPDVFQFELTDLYDAKDVPKVWFCLHAISYKINTLNPEFPAMENLVGKLQFDSADIKTASRALSGHHLPNFASADNADMALPGTSSYMNKALSVASPSKSPGKFSSQGSSPVPSIEKKRHENPFLESHTPNPATKSIHTFKLNSVQVPDLTVNSHVDSDAVSSRNSPSSLTIDKLGQYYSPALEAEITNILKLQALCKGSVLRYNMFVKKIMLKSYDIEFTDFFSVIRGNLVRARTVHRHRDELLLYKEDIVRLQSIARRKQLQRCLLSAAISSEQMSVQAFQSVIRGSLLRRSMRETLTSLERHQKEVQALQCIALSKPVHYRVSTILKHKESIEPSVVDFQAVACRVLYAHRKNESVISHLELDKRLIELQSLIRGGQGRNRVRRCLRVLFKQTAVLSELQSIGRGAITRTRLCNNVLITLLGEDIKMTQLFAKARANFVRDDYQYKRYILEKEEGQIVALQSAFRGILFRFNQSVDTEEIYDNVDSVIALQAKIRANAVSAEIRRMKLHYLSQEDKVIKAQAILRSKYTQNAYKAFIMMTNPPVDVVRKFAYLLSDSGADFEEEMQLTKLKDEIMEKSKGNEDLEAQIENLDIKLGLLDKNKISIEDFMKHNTKFKTYKPVLQNIGVKKSLDNLNKSSKKRIELYLSMFYFLQTNPAYWMRLFEAMAPQDPKRPLKNLHSQVAPLFSLPTLAVNSTTREDYFFMKLVICLMANDMKQNSSTIADITKIKCTFWIPFLVELNNQMYQRMHLKRHFGRAVERILDDDEVTFESDPSKIYDLLRKHELNVYGQSQKKKSVAPLDAIKDNQVSSQFVKNLMSLRDATSEIMESLRLGVSKLPIHMRIVARKAYELSQARYPEHTEQLHLSVAGVIIIKHYIGNLLQFPENFGYSTQDPIASKGLNPTRNADNLRYVYRVLLQVFSMKAFSDSFMKPLNDFVLSYIDTTKTLVKDIINVKDLEVEYEMNDYDDLVSHDRPQLTMKVSDMIAIEKLISRNLDIVVPSLDDQLYAIFSELNDLVNSADDFVTLTEMGSLTLSLSPVSQETSMADSKTRNLFAQAKRCLLYVIRVQDGDDLLELFVLGIKPHHETKFRHIIESETGEKSGERGTNRSLNPYNRSSLGDLSAMSYVNLKKLALKVILQLENMGKVTRKNSYQELLNQVVVDIKTKNSRRKSRKSQLLIASQTVKKLLEKEHFLKRQLNDYNKHIDQVLSELQLKPKDKKIFNVIPMFSKQYFYHRQLKKNNRLPKFGSYKYSAKKLMEQGVVKDIAGALYRKSASSSKVEFMFSCHKSGVFLIEAANGIVNIPGACNTITLDEVLEYQYERKSEWNMFNGMVTFDTEGLASLIFKNFYDIRKD